MSVRRALPTALVGVLLTAAACTPAAPPDRAGELLSPAWRASATNRVADLVQPGPPYPMVAAPIEPDPVRYADAVRHLAGAGALTPDERRRATDLLTAWWPAEDPEGFGRLALVRALVALDALDRLPADRLTATVTWARSTVADPAQHPDALRRTVAAAQFAALLRAADPATGATDARAGSQPAFPDVTALDRALAQAAARTPCDSARSVAESIPRAVLAVAAGRPCPVSPVVREAAAGKLRGLAGGARSGSGTADLAEPAVGDLTDLAVLATAGVVDRTTVRDAAQRALASAGTAGERLRVVDILPLADAVDLLGAPVTLSPAQLEALRRAVRSEARLPDRVGAGDPLDTALAVDALRRLGRPAPGPVAWETRFTLLDRTILALALDRRQLPSVAEATSALVGQPPATMLLGYLAVAHPGLCLDQTRELRARISVATDLAQWPGDRLLHTALLVAVTPDCGGADQARLTEALTAALGAAAAGPAVDGYSALIGGWQRAETGCLLGDVRPYLPDRAELRTAIDREVGSTQVRADVTVRHVYAALRLTQLVTDPASCDATWWNSPTSE